jgi:hypothetical protein
VSDSSMLVEIPCKKVSRATLGLFGGTRMIIPKKASFGNCTASLPVNYVKTQHCRVALVAQVASCKVARARPQHPQGEGP